VVAFYEPFNESLAYLSLEDAKQFGPTAWTSRHPITDPYFAEMFPLFRSGVVGLPLFYRRFAFEHFFPEKDNRELDAEETAYLNSLLTLVSSSSVAVFACTRSLARIEPLRKTFGGVHVFSYRSLFDQWLSYLRQYALGNDYFLRATAWTLEYARGASFVRELHSRYWAGPNHDAAFAGFGTEENALAAFTALHLYLYGRAVTQADITLDVTKCTVDQDYRRGAEDQLAKFTGVSISLADANRSIPVVAHHISPDIVRKVTVDVLDRHGWNQLQRDFIESLASELMEASTNYRAFAGPVLAEIDDVQRQNDELRRQNNELVEEVRIQAHHLQEMQHAIDDLHRSTSWRVTAPFRAVMQRVK
jgi:hypothetical protein